MRRRLQIDEMSGDRFELMRRGSLAEEWGGSKRSVDNEQELVRQLFRVARARLSAELSQAMS